MAPPTQPIYSWGSHRINIIDAPVQKGKMEDY